MKVIQFVGMICLLKSLPTSVLIYFIQGLSIIVDINLYFYWEKYVYISNVEICKVILLGIDREWYGWLSLREFCWKLNSIEWSRGEVEGVCACVFVFKQFPWPFATWVRWYVADMKMHLIFLIRTSAFCPNNQSSKSIT
jgi:hypothetical protein